MRIIYDVGANNGEDISYYLLKADLVVAIEANPVLAQRIRERFSAELGSGRLAVESFVVTDLESGPEVPFYIHRDLDILSQFPKPHSDRIAEFDQVFLPSKKLTNIIRQYGTPHYVKIDIQHYDQVVLKSMFMDHIFPPYVSAESHSVEVFCNFVALGGYRLFKLVDGETISQVFENHPISTTAGHGQWSFPHHSSGPFGNDIPGPWVDPDQFIRTLGVEGMGWRDIHVSSVD